MRLFVSTNIPEEISDYIKELATKLPEAKLIIPRNIDLTIKFIGAVQDYKLEEIKKRLSEIKFKPFEATLDGIGVFPNENFIRVVWAGLAPENKFNELHKKTEAALKSIVPAEKRFKPHLTLARIKRVSDKQKFVEELKKIRVEPKKFLVDKLVLFQSRLGPRGATHEKIMEIPAQQQG